jgi:hypothetical protein
MSALISKSYNKAQPVILCEQILSIMMSSFNSALDDNFDS